MRCLPFAFTVLVLAGCKGPTPANVDASAPEIAERAPSARLVEAAPQDASPPTDDTRSRTAAAPLELVAVGGRFGPRIVWLTANGSRVWLSGVGLDAYADGDGPLVPGPDLLKGLPYESRKQSVTVAGGYPSLFAFRRNDVPCAVVDEPALFVRRNAAWIEAKSAREAIAPPFAFVAWNDGALLVDSQIANCGWAMSGAGPLADGPGTTFTYVAPNGTVGHPTLGLDPTFMAWGASSTGATLAMVGTFGIRQNADGSVSGSRDIIVMRRRDQDPFQSTVIVRGRGTQMGSLRTSVREFGSAALLWPPPVRDNGTPVAGAPAEGGDEAAWKGHASSLFVIADAKPKELTFRTPAEQDCHVADAALVGQTVYAVVQCPNVAPRLVRFGADGSRERVELPMLERTNGGDGGLHAVDARDASFRCHPRKLVVRLPDDLWVQAQCGSESEAIAAVFRRGRAQEPVVLP